MAYAKARKIDTMFSISAERRAELTRAAAEIVADAHTTRPGGGLYTIDGDKLGIKTKAEADYFWAALCKLDNVKTIF